MLKYTEKPNQNIGDGNIFEYQYGKYQDPTLNHCFENSCSWCGFSKGLRTTAWQLILTDESLWEETFQKNYP